MRSLEEVAPGAAFSIETDGRAVSSKPELAVLVARVFAAWSSVEAFVGLCAKALLAGRSEVAEKIYGVLSENSLQYLALYEAADAALPVEDAKLFCKALRAVKRLGAGRHFLAHGVYAEVQGVSGLAIFEQRDFAQLTRVFFTTPREGESREDQVRRLHREAARHAKVVEAEDLNSILKDIDWAADLALHAAALAAPVHTDKEGARRGIADILAKANVSP